VDQSKVVFNNLRKVSESVFSPLFFSRTVSQLFLKKEEVRGPGAWWEKREEASSHLEKKGGGQFPP